MGRMPHWSAMGGRSWERKRTGMLDVFDGIDAVFYGIGGVVLLALVLIKGTLAAQDLAGPVAGGAVIAGYLLVIGLSVRDARRRRWSASSIGLAAAWAIAVGALIVNDSAAI